MPSWMVFALLVLATFRLTRLAVVDEFPPIRHLRERITLDDDGEDRNTAWAYLATCPHCMSVWLSGMVVGATWLVLNVWGDGMPLPVLWWGGVAGAVSLIYELLPE